MAAPDVEAADEDGEESDDPPEEPEAPPDDDDDVEVATASVEETGVDPEGFFDDVEESSPNSDDVSDTIFDGTEDSGDDGDGDAEAASTRTGGLADDINNGASRLAVIGLDDEWTTESGETRKKDDLQTEFKETFEAFRLGHYGSEVIEEYMLVEAEDIHPVWGLVGAMLICAAVVIYRRPDGDQMVETTKIKLGQADLSTLKANA